MESVPNVEEITNLKIVLHLERHAISVTEKNHFSNKCPSKNDKHHINAATNSEETGDKISDLDETEYI